MLQHFHQAAVQVNFDEARLHAVCEQEWDAHRHVRGHGRPQIEMRGQPMLLVIHERGDLGERRVRQMASRANGVDARAELARRAQHRLAGNREAARGKRAAANSGHCSIRADDAYVFHRYLQRLGNELGE